MKNLILILIIVYILYCLNKNKNIDNYKNVESPSGPDFVEGMEGWRDLPFIGNKDLVNYNRLNTVNYSRRNLPVYYPINSNIEDNYFNNITSPKLSLLRTVLRQVYLLVNQNTQPIVYNNTNRPVQYKTVNKNYIKTLSDTIIKSINNFGEPMLKVKLLQTLNELHEETEEQSRINFDMALELNYTDVYSKKPDTIFVQAEFIFEKSNKILDELQFFNKTDKKIDFKTHLSKLLVIGASNDGFLRGNEKKN
jgi:hypothetical protein